MLLKESPLRDTYIETARPILQRLERAGFEAWLVGGCVREALRAEMQAERSETFESAALTDIDVTTNALPEEICQVFSDMAVIETGIRHGTVTVLLPAGETCDAAAAGADTVFADDSGPDADATGSSETAAADGSVSGRSGARRIPIEITTYRVDGSYSDGRHPDQVRFVTSLTEDLRRRDFTVNAMAMDLRGDLADPFGGRADLAAGVIRAVGDPETRFREDGLRILRALRFAAVLNFRIEPQTEAALFRCAHLLEGISAERIFIELKKLVCGPAAGDVIRRYADILTVIIPELAPMKNFDQHNPYHKYDVLEHCIRAMETVRGVSVEAPAYLKLAALLHDIGKPSTFTQDENGIGHFYGHPQVGAELLGQVLRRLKADRWTIDRITTLVRYHDLVFQEDDRLLKRWISRYTPEVLLEILELKRADNIATGNVSQELLDKFARIDVQIRGIISAREQGQACISTTDLVINGKDLIAAGIPEGPQIGEILQKLVDSVIDGKIPNEREALLEAALGSYTKIHGAMSPR